MWIAKKTMTVRRAGKNVIVNIGDPVPEADTWPNLKSWVNTGYIKWVRREELPAKVPVKVEVHAKPSVREADIDTPVLGTPRTGKKIKVTKAADK